VAVRGSTSLLFALLAEATATGSWAALVGMPNLGLRAAAELGVAVDRLALVRHPGADLPRVVAALLDGMDLVAVDPSRLTDSQIHRLSARARHRGTVLVSTGAWPGADLELTQEAATWSGLGDGHGHLAEREVRVSVRGRGAATRATETRLCLPAEGGTVQPPTDSFGAFGTDRLSPPKVDAPKDPSVPTPREEAAGGTKLTVLTDLAEEPAGPAAPWPDASGGAFGAPAATDPSSRLDAARGTLETLDAAKGTLETLNVPRVPLATSGTPHLPAGSASLPPVASLPPGSPPAVSPPAASPPAGSPSAASPPSAFPLSASPAPLSSRPISLSLAPPLPASPPGFPPAASPPPTSPGVARLAASLGPASPACGFAFEQDDPADDTVLAGHGA
jgi:hypothetical protein